MIEPKLLDCFNSWEDMETFYLRLTELNPDIKLGAIGIVGANIAAVFYEGEKDSKYYKLVEKLEKGYTNDD